jgi:hypothetical protein
MSVSRRNQRRCVTLPGETSEQKWERIYGTTAFGNLPQYTKHEHVGSCWVTCPYSTLSTDQRTIDLLGSLVTKVEHQDSNNKDYYMRPVYRGQWGYECTFDDCPYYLSTGLRYFYS